MPAPDASHSPALSSWFRLLCCLDEGSHAERVSGVGQKLSLSQGLALPGTHAEGLKMTGGQSLAWVPAAQRCQGSGEGAGRQLGCIPAPGLLKPAGAWLHQAAKSWPCRWAGASSAVIFSYVCSVQLPDPSACLSLGFHLFF